MSDNGPCYASEIFTNLMVEYNVNHITSSPLYPQFNGLAEKYGQIVKNLFHKAKEEGKDLYTCLMVYCNTPLSSTLQSPMEILTSIAARSSLPMSNAARRQKGLECKDSRAHCKNEHTPTHDFHIGQSVMYLNPVNRRWYLPQSQVSVKNLEVTRSKQMVVLYTEKHRTTWNCIN